MLQLLDRYTVATRSYQAPGLVEALRQSYHIRVSPSQRRAAVRLLASIAEIRPAVWAVGDCIVDLWRGSCTCQQARARKSAGILPTAKPCTHFVSLFLVGRWSPIVADPCATLRSLGVTQPEIIAVYCRARVRPGYPAAPAGYRVLEVSNGTASLENVATGTTCLVSASSVRCLRPFYA